MALTFNQLLYILIPLTFKNVPFNANRWTFWFTVLYCKQWEAIFLKFELHINPDLEEAVYADVHSRSDFTEQLEQLVMAYNGADSITAYADGEMKVIGFNEVECVTVLDGKTLVIDTHGRQYKIRYKLYEAAKLLPSYYIKINKSTIANKKQIECFQAAFSGSVNVVFKSGYTDYVSRRCFAEIKKELRK